MDASTEAVIHILQNPGCSPWEVVRNSTYPYRETINAIDSLLRQQLIHLIEHGLYSKDNEMSFLAENFVTCPTCKDRLVPPNSWSGRILEDWRTMTLNRPAEDHRYTQHHVTEQTILCRAAFIAKRTQIRPVNLALLGDDDLTSVAIALIDPEAHVTVLEADMRLVEFINVVARTYSLNIEAFSYNAVDPLPLQFRGRFNTFFCDPAPTNECLKVFLSRLIDALDVTVGTRCFVSNYANHQKIYLDFQRTLTDMGLFITAIIPKFTTYRLIKEQINDSLRSIIEQFPEDDALSFTESMIELTVTEETRSLVTGQYQGTPDQLLGLSM